MSFTFHRCWNYEMIGWDLLCRIRKIPGSKRDSIQNPHDLVIMTVYKFSVFVSISTYTLIHAVCSTCRIIHINNPYYLSPQKKYLWSSVLYFEFLRFVFWIPPLCIFVSRPVLGPTASYWSSTKYKASELKYKTSELKYKTSDHVFFPWTKILGIIYTVWLHFLNHLLHFSFL